MQILSLLNRFLPEKIIKKIELLTGKIEIYLNAGDSRALAVKTALFTFSVRVISAVMAYLIQIILARLMGSFEYGIYVIIWVWLVVLGTLTAIGLPTGVLKLIPELTGQNDKDSLRGLIRYSRLATLSIATLASIVGISITLLFPTLFDQAFILPIILAAFCLPAITLTEIQDGIARANDWPDLAHIPPYIARPALIAFFFVVLEFFGADKNASVAVAATIAGAWIVALIQFLILNKRLKKNLVKGPRKYNAKSWIAISLPMLLVESFFLLIINTDIMVAGLFLTPDKVAIYFAAAKTLALVHFVYFAVRAGTAHKISHYYSIHDYNRLDNIVHDAIRWTFWPSLLLSVILILFGPFILSLFGAGFADGMPYLVILIIGVLVRASIGPAESMLTMAGAQKKSALIYGYVFGANLVLNFLLIPWIGLFGAAIATSTSMIIETILLSKAVKDHIGITCFITKLKNISLPKKFNETD